MLLVLAAVRTVAVMVITDRQIDIPNRADRRSTCLRPAHIAAATR
jgi:hypothetical protein